MSYNSKKLTKEEKDLLDIFRSSNLSIDDVKWIKNKWWFKRFLKIYIKELKKLPVQKNDKSKSIKKDLDNIEILDFTQTINIPTKEVIEILDFTKTIDITKIKNISLITEKTRKKLEFEKNVLYGVILACIVGIILLVIILLLNGNDKKENLEITEDIEEVAEVKDIELEEESIIETEDNRSSDTTTVVNDLYSKYGNLEMLQVNLNVFKENNSDTVGWIKVNGTNVNYPFVQTSDNGYYLKHSFDKTYNKKGWVFLDYRNNFNNFDKNTILYAHGLVNNQMFGSLRKIFNSSWYTNKDNYIIKTATYDSSQLWEVFSIYTIEPENYYISTYFNNEDEFKTFVDVIKGRSIYNFNTEVSSSDRILTLSSCYDNDKRMVLHAKLIANQLKN